MIKYICLFLILVGGVPSAIASDCNEGMKLYVMGKFEEAFKIFKPLAESGDSCALYQLGEMYKLGDGVKKDKSKAIKFFKQAAEKGNAKAKFQLEVLSDG